MVKAFAEGAEKAKRFLAKKIENQGEKQPVQ